MKTIDFNKEIWEGWTVQDFIEELEEEIDTFVSNSREFHTNITRNDIKKFCMDNQPYYKKYIPDVVNYFCNRYNIK